MVRCLWHDWYTFFPSMEPALMEGHKYYIFFGMRRSDPRAPIAAPYRLDLFVESAYQRSTRVEMKIRWPFGKAAERTAKELRI